MPEFVLKHGVPRFFAMTLALSWSGILLVVGGHVLSDPRFPVVSLAMLAGLLPAGFLLTGIVDGSAGPRQLVARLKIRRVLVRRYFFPVVLVPLLVTAVALGLSLSSPLTILTTQDKAPLLLIGLGDGLGAGIF